MISITCISSPKGYKKCDSTALTTYFYIVRAVLSENRSRMEDWSTLLFLLEYLYETVDIDRKAYREGAACGHRRTPIIVLWRITEKIIYRKVQIDGIQESLLESELPQLICLVMLLDICIRCRKITTRQSSIDAIERTELAIVI